MNQNTKKRSIDLTKLAGASKGLEAGNTGGPTARSTESSETPYTPEPLEESEHKETGPEPSKAFRSYMAENPKMAGQPRKAVPLNIDLHKKVSKVAEAESTDIIVIVNNIVDAWLKKNAAECKKSVDRANSIFG